VGVTVEPSGPERTGRKSLLDDGYPFVAGVDTGTDDFDTQGHLNNAAIVRLLNDLRMGFVHSCLGQRWTDHLGAEGVVVVARELHVLYETEGLPGESFVGGVRVSRRQGKAGIVEQRLVESAAGRPIARAWVVQLLVREGVAVPWPDWYWELVAGAQGGPVPGAAPVARPAWGPPG
jgi:acyl-CoA thioesterase FadM